MLCQPLGTRRLVLVGGITGIGRHVEHDDVHVAALVGQTHSARAVNRTQSIGPQLAHLSLQKHDEGVSAVCSEGPAPPRLLGVVGDVGLEGCGQLHASLK